MGEESKSLCENWEAESGRLQRAHVLEMIPSDLATSSERAVIDVRAVEERLGELGYLPGSRSFPESELMASVERLSEEYGKSHPLVLVCVTGKRSLHMATELRGHGFDDVAHLKGGMLGWQAAGMPLCGVCRVPEGDLIPLASPGDFPRVVLSCFVAESVETQLDCGADQLRDPTELVERIFGDIDDRAPFEELLGCLDRLAEQARKSGHALENIALNVDRMRASLLSLFN